MLVFLLFMYNMSTCGIPFQKPFYEKPHSDSSVGMEFQTSPSAVARRRLFELCDGTRTMDEICVNTALSTRELMEFCSSEPNLHLL